MKAKPYKQNDKAPGLVECEPNDADHVLIRMKGPSPNRMLPVILRGSRRDHTGPVWTWNGDTEKPTLRPSVCTKGAIPLTDEQADAVLAGQTFEPQHFTCHTWITDGQSIFLSDCTHEFAGQTLDLLEVE